MFSSLANSLDSLESIFNLVYRYLLFTGSFFLFFYVWKKRKYWFAKVQQQYPERKHIYREIKYSFITMIIFGMVILLTIWAGRNGLTQFYDPVDKYGYAYYFFSILLMIIVHDTYF